MPHYRLTLAYDGTDFAGWQLQTGGAPARTVQGVLGEALSRLALVPPVRVAGAGRTDAGVHAEGQVASFDLDRPLPPEALVRALNGLLPADVRALSAAEAPPGFHARKSAVSKTYRYWLDTGPVQLPVRRRFASHCALPLDEGRMREAAALYLGRHDFASLASSGGSARTTVRTLARSDLLRTGYGFAYEAAGDGFLRKMVRSLVGGLLWVGQGKGDVEGLRRALERRDRRAWPPPAEACGLTLVRVDYPATEGGG